MIKAVLFDMDGVLIASKEAVLASAGKALEKMGLPFKKGFEKTIFGRPNKVVFPIAYPECAGRAEEFDRLYTIEYNGNHLQNTKLLPAVLETIGWLKEHKIKTGITTSKKKYAATQTAKILGINVDTIVAFEDYKNARPHPEPIEKALERLGASKREAVYVGDTVLDVKQATNAGVLGIAITTGTYTREELEAEKPCHVIDSLAEIPEIISKHNVF